MDAVYQYATQSITDRYEQSCSCGSWKRNDTNINEHGIDTWASTEIWVIRDLFKKAYVTVTPFPLQRKGMGVLGNPFYAIIFEKDDNKKRLDILEMIFFMNEFFLNKPNTSLYYKTIL